MLDGVLHVITGVALTTLMLMLAVTDLYIDLFVGVNVVFRVYVPAESTVPEVGL